MRKRKINIIILNYNGKKLLEKYLSSVVEASRSSNHDCRVSVIDNKSTDGSCRYIRDNFEEVILYETKENRFLCSYNEYLKQIDDEIVIFLNNDIEVDKYFVDPLIGYFDDKDVLFVSPEEHRFLDSGYKGNLNRLVFRRGLVVPLKETDAKTANSSSGQLDISVHGGAFNREKFLFLEGYDDLYLPGIVEDFDLCYRGWKYGWKGLFEPKSFYRHEASTSFNAKFGESGRLTLNFRNCFLFFWKNITSKSLWARHILSIPFLLLYALVRPRWFIIKGFFQAIPLIPEVIKRRKKVKGQFKISDKEVFKIARDSRVN